MMLVPTCHKQAAVQVNKYALKRSRIPAIKNDAAFLCSQGPLVIVSWKPTCHGSAILQVNKVKHVHQVHMVEELVLLTPFLLGFLNNRIVGLQSEHA